MPGGTPAQRGYGSAHRTLRAQWAPAVAMGTVRCVRCHEPIAPNAPWDLGHTDDRTGYLGLSCSSCNRSAGASKRQPA